MHVETRPLSELTERAIDLLVRELGVADALRFLNQFSTGQGDYTRDRSEMLEGVSLDEMLEDIKRHRPG